MTDQTVEVHVDLHGTTVLVGHLHARSTRGRDGASFVYADEWLRHPERFALEPGLESRNEEGAGAHARILKPNAHFSQAAGPGLALLMVGRQTQRHHEM